jgi:hypothetical protein
VAVTAYASGTKTPTYGTVTVTIASPAVFTFTSHSLAVGDKITLTTTGALPTGLTAGTTYYVIAAGLTANAFEVSTSAGGSAVNTSGSQSGTHTITSEHFVTLPNVAATFQFIVDTINMAASDTVELRAYQMVLTGGTARVIYKTIFAGAQSTDDLIKACIPVSNELTDTGATQFSIKQTSGTARAFPWKALKFA